MDITATLYWAPAVLNGTVSAACACKRGRWCAGCGRKCLPLGPPKPNIPEDNCVGYCSVGHGNRLPGCCFGPNASCTPPGLKFFNGFGSKIAISSYAPAPSVSPQGSSKPLFGQCSLALASRCRVYCVFFCGYGDEIPHSCSAYYFGSLSPFDLVKISARSCNSLPKFCREYPSPISSFMYRSTLAMRRQN